MRSMRPRANKKKTLASKPRQYYMVRGNLRDDGTYTYEYQNKFGKLVRLDDINEYGIRNIYNRLCDAEDRVPYCWIQAVKDHARSRSIPLQELPRQMERTG